MDMGGSYRHTMHTKPTLPTISAHGVIVDCRETVISCCHEDMKNHEVGDDKGRE